MPKSIVRITNIYIKNFKNVRGGEISFINNRKNFNASILGLYGQNGSGKTALIDAIELLKYALRGMKLPQKYVDYINIDSNSAEIEYTFNITLDNEEYSAVYSIKLSKELLQSEGNFEGQVNEKRTYTLKIEKEVLKCQTLQKRMGKIIDTDSKIPFGPKSKYDLLIGGDKNISAELFLSKMISQKTAQSYIFSRELLEKIRNNKLEIKDEKNLQELSHYLNIMEALVKYGNLELFIINTSNSGLISLNAQPLVFKISGENKGAYGNIAIPIEEPSVIPEDLFKVTSVVIDNMNIVLEQIVSGLTIGIKDLGDQIMEDGVKGKKVEFISNKNSKEIPLRYESDGIKKIVSILQLLVVLYNKKSITVAIDELDSGVFEYLLGEILRIIAEKGKGQLIFTSHNLRPLETLDRGFIAFTTTNSENRYIRLSNVQENNNLRDLYYRDILLGSDKDEVYDLTNNEEIAFAFREAGEAIG